MKQRKKYHAALKTSFLCLSLTALFLPFMAPPVAAQTSQVSAEDSQLVQKAFEGLPESDRKAIQDALMWLGFYNTSISGSFNRQTYAGLVAYQKKVGGTPDKVLATTLIEKLKNAGRAARSAAGFEIIRDEKTGIEIGLPLKVLPKQGSTSLGGGRWQSSDDKITLDTRRIQGGAAEFIALYEKAITPGPERKVTYKLQKNDLFVVSGETTNGVFYIRYALGEDELRGFSVGYDKSMKSSFDPMVIAIANSFNPFPSDRKPEAIGQKNETVVSTAPVMMAPTVSAKAATGIRISQRNVVTVGLACDMPKINGRPAKMVKQANSLALWDIVDDGQTMAVLPIQNEALAEGADVVVISWDAASRAVGVVTGSVESEQKLSIALQTGGRGGLVFDRYGAVIGLVDAAVTPVRALGGATMRANYSFVPVQNVLTFTGSANSFTGKADRDGALSTGAIAEIAMTRVVEVVCP